MRKALPVVFLTLLTACGEPGPTAEEQARLDAQAIAEVEAAQVPPPEMLAPQTMDFADFERHGILGVGCSFAPAGGGEDPIAVAMTDAAYMKIDGAIDQFASDAGSAQSAYGTWTGYDSGSHSMQLELLDGEGKQVGMETIEHEARLTLRDGRDRVVYDAEGTALCGA